MLTIDERAKLARLQGDLVWLVREGYVTEFIDGRLFAPPAVVEARKKEIEAEEHDPENFPDAPAVEASPAPVPEQFSSPVGAVGASAVAEAPVATPEMAPAPVGDETPPTESKPAEPTA
jgi:hypothetical protein